MGRSLHDLNQLPGQPIACVLCSVHYRVWLSQVQAQISLKNCPSPWTAILAQDVNMAFLLPCPRCIATTPYHEQGAWGRNFHLLFGCISLVASHQHTKELGLMSPGWTRTHQHISLRPVILVPILVPACPSVAWAVMIRSQSGASGWTSWKIPNNEFKNCHCINAPLLWNYNLLMTTAHSRI